MLRKGESGNYVNSKYMEHIVSEWGGVVLVRSETD
jgi:hypothetical protein